MDKARLEKLSKIMNVVKKDFVSSTDVKSFLYSIITFAKENKQELENLSKEYLQTINEAIEDIENQNKTLLENVSNKTAQNQTDFESQVKELKEILKKVKAIKTTKPADGIDGVNPNPEDVVPLVLEKLPKQEEITGEKIVDKINALSLDEENKIDASHIKNLPESKMIRGGSTARNLYQLMDVNISAPTNAQVLKYNSTNNVWENGTDSASASWGEITGTLSNQTDLQTVLDTKTTKNFAIAMALALG